MMLDRNLAAVSPSTVYRVLKAAGLLQDRFSRPSRKGKGFLQPLEPHQHWHIDFSFINITGTFYYLCSVLDGCSRYIVCGRLRECLAQVHYVTAADRSGIRRLWVSRELEPLSTAANHLSFFFTLTTFQLPGPWTTPTLSFTRKRNNTSHHLTQRKVA